jgi:hypothetical protein
VRRKSSQSLIHETKHPFPDGEAFQFIKKHFAGDKFESFSLDEFPLSL